MPDYVPRPSIGGSDVSAILGISRYKTGSQVWDRIQGYHRSQDDSPILERGRKMEPIIADIYHQQTGNPICESETFFHPQHPFLHGTPDRLIYRGVRNAPDDGILEIKCLGKWTFEQTKNEGLSPEYYAQIQHYLFVTGMTWAEAAIFNADAWELYIIPIDRDEEHLAQVVPRLLEWWETYVETGTRPPSTTIEDHYVPARVGAEAEDWRDNNEWNEAVSTLRTATDAYKLAKHRKELAANVVKTMMGDVQVALSAVGKINWKEYTSRRLDEEALLASHPEVDLNQFKLARVSRRFSPSFDE